MRSVLKNGAMAKERMKSCREGQNKHFYFPGCMYRPGQTLSVLPILCSHNINKCSRRPTKSFVQTKTSSPTLYSLSWAKSLFFRKTYAEEKSKLQTETSIGKVEQVELSQRSTNVNTKVAFNGDLTTVGTDDGDNNSVQEEFFEFLARRYIDRESGNERVKMIFTKDHKGDSSDEMLVFKNAMPQVLIISFLLKYVPTWKLAKEDFIRENRGTVFRTRLEAARRLSDHVSLVASKEAGMFAAKMTTFSAGILLTSQMLSSYNNKTSISDYSFAAGLTGGFARLSLGPKGFVTGALVGSILGTFVGGVAVLLLRHWGLTQEERHFQATIQRLKVQKSIAGEDKFQSMVADLVKS